MSTVIKHPVYLFHPFRKAIYKPPGSTMVLMRNRVLLGRRGEKRMESSREETRVHREAEEAKAK